MGSKFSPRYYSEDTVKTVEDAFREVWWTLAENDPQVANNPELRLAVIHRLLDLLDEGIREPEELRTLTFSHFIAQPPT